MGELAGTLSGGSMGKSHQQRRNRVTKCFIAIQTKILQKKPIYSLFQIQRPIYTKHFALEGHRGHFFLSTGLCFYETKNFDEVDN